ncbi:hypothetical protein RUM44_009835 [Polyplax serrata]|uniref:Uncharacterized protein n=1 Tax=Polyplax serrata TaxID=468196 RepID=A0ABR1ATU3_POLSC
MFSVRTSEELRERSGGDDDDDDEEEENKKTKKKKKNGRETEEKVDFFLQRNLLCCYSSPATRNTPFTPLSLDFLRVPLFPPRTFQIHLYGSLLRVTHVHPPGYKEIFINLSFARGGTGLGTDAHTERPKGKLFFGH